MKTPRGISSKYCGYLKIGFLIAVFCGIVMGCASTPDPVEQKILARQKYDEADRANSLNQKAEYINKLKEAAALDPSDPFYRVALGDAYFSNGQLDEAEQAYLAALKLDNEYYTAYRQLGRLYISRQQWDNAIFYLNRALSAPNIIEPHQVYNWLAYSYYRKGNLNQAEKTWLKAISIRENSEIRLNLALVYKEAEQYDLALESLEKAVELDPKLARAHYELGQLYLKGRRFAEARKHLREAIQLEPLSDQAKTAREYLKLMPKG